MTENNHKTVYVYTEPDSKPRPDIRRLEALVGELTAENGAARVAVVIEYPSGLRLTVEHDDELARRHALDYDR